MQRPAATIDISCGALLDYRDMAVLLFPPMPPPFVQRLLFPPLARLGARRGY